MFATSTKLTQNRLTNFWTEWWKTLYSGFLLRRESLLMTSCWITCTLSLFRMCMCALDAQCLIYHASNIRRNSPFKSLVWGSLTPARHNNSSVQWYKVWPSHYVYCIARKFDGELSLEVQWAGLKLPKFNSTNIMVVRESLFHFYGVQHKSPNLSQIPGSKFLTIV